MKKHLRKILLGILVLLALGFFAERALLDSTASSLAGRTPEILSHRALLMPERGTVEVRRAGSPEWTAATEEVSLSQGDAVRTGAGASAALYLFEQGVARLDENAAITIEALAWDQETNSFTGKILLEGGRLWSRLLDFLAPESSYEVQTPHLVATVRGTAFFANVSGMMDEVQVVEHLVGIASADGKAKAEVAEGQVLRYTLPASGALERVSANVWKVEDTKGMGNDAWIQGNIEKDAIYVKRVDSRLQGDLERFVPRPDMSLRVEEKERAALGKNRDRMQSVATRALSRLVAEALVAARRGDVDATEALVERARRFCAYAQANGAACRVHPRLIEYVAHHPDLSSGLKDAALRLSPDMAETLLRVLERRERFEKATTSGTDASANVVPREEVIAPAVLPAPIAPKPLQLEIIAQRFVFSPGESAPFNAVLRWSDGRSEDVTKLAVWSLATAPGTKPIGQMRANVFLAGTAGGTAELSVFYQGDLGTFFGVHEVSVTAPASPTVN